MTETKIEFRGIATSRALRARVMGAMTDALAALPRKPTRARVVFSDVNGPKGGEAIRKALGAFYPAIDEVHLFDYKVRILDGESATGARTRVIIDGPSADHALVLKARLSTQAPDIDASVYLTECDPSSYRAGDFADVEIVGANGYDLIARPL